MKHIILKILEIIAVAGLVMGFVYLFGEANPWSIQNQIKLFLTGIFIILVSAGMICLIENIDKGGKHNDITRS